MPVCEIQRRVRGGKIGNNDDDNHPGLSPNYPIMRMKNEKQKKQKKNVLSS